MKNRSIILLLAAVIVSTFATAQSLLTPIPQDPDVRVGVLDNGLTYYIRANSYPKGQADFYIYSDVGAAQEADDQQGLAHFMEHMAFNGTKNLPGKQIIEYLETIGVKFGENLNAYTSLDETVYMMKDVPLTREGIIDTALLILHDWAYYIDPQGEEIDKERGVIKEELRTRDGASWRSSIELFKALGRGTVYENRNIIGYLDFLESFPYDALTRFYHDWYRPDYQALIIVGDIDVDSIEQKIITLCSDIPAAAADAPQKDVVIVPDNDKAIVSIYSDPEMTQSTLLIIAKGEAMPFEERNTMKAARKDVIESYISTMENYRLDDLSYEDNTPLQYAYFGVGSLGIIPTMEAELLQAVTKEGRIEEAFELVYTELERMRRYGFNQSEWQRAQVDLLSTVKREYDSRNDRKNGDYIYDYIDAYSQNTPIPSPLTRYQIDSTLIMETTLEQINEVAQGFDFEKNMVITINSPQKEGLDIPTNEQIVALMGDIRARDITPKEELTELPPLISDEISLAGSKVISQSIVEEVDAVEWILDNGIKVVIKPTTFKQNEIKFTASADGGASLLGDEEYLTGLQYFSSLMSSNMGLAEFSRVELERVLAGKNAWTYLTLGRTSSSVAGGSTPEDIETLLQLIYLRFTAPRYSETDFNNTIEKFYNSLANRYSDPDMQAQREFNSVLYNNHPHREMVSTQTLERVKFEQLSSIYETLFSDADSYLFTFVGNIDLESFKPLVEKYIGSLHVDADKMSWLDDGVRRVDGEVSHSFSTKMEQPKVGVNYRLSLETEVTPAKNMMMLYLVDALNNLYLESIREEMGGSYGVRVRQEIERRPTEEYALSISFDTNIEMAEDIMESVADGLNKIAQEGASAEQIGKTREFQSKNFANQQENNAYWVHLISELYNYNEDLLSTTQEHINSVTNDDIKSLAKELLNSGNIVKVVMLPQ